MEYLRENLVPLAPSLSSRLKKPVRVPGASGRLYRGPEGAWEWVDESQDKNGGTDPEPSVAADLGDEHTEG